MTKTPETGLHEVYLMKQNNLICFYKLYITIIGLIDWCSAAAELWESGRLDFDWNTFLFSISMSNLRHIGP